MNSIMERWIGSCRHELLDRTLVWNQRHLMTVLREPGPGRGPRRPRRAPLRGRREAAGDSDRACGGQRPTRRRRRRTAQPGPGRPGDRRLAQARAARRRGPAHRRQPRQLRTDSAGHSPHQLGPPPLCRAARQRHPPDERELRARHRVRHHGAGDDRAARPSGQPPLRQLRYLGHPDRRGGSNWPASKEPTSCRWSSAGRCCCTSATVPTRHCTGPSPPRCLRQPRPSEVAGRSSSPITGRTAYERSRVGRPISGRDAGSRSDGGCPERCCQLVPTAASSDVPDSARRLHSGDGRVPSLRRLCGRLVALLQRVRRTGQCLATLQTGAAQDRDHPVL